MGKKREIPVDGSEKNRYNLFQNRIILKEDRA